MKKIIFLGLTTFLFNSNFVFAQDSKLEKVDLQGSKLVANFLRANDNCRKAVFSSSIPTYNTAGYYISQIVGTKTSREISYAFTPYGPMGATRIVYDFKLNFELSEIDNPNGKPISIELKCQERQR